MPKENTTELYKETWEILATENQILMIEDYLQKLEVEYTITESRLSS